MKTKSVFEFATYKPYLAYRLSSKEHRGQLSRAAEAIQTQRSYLSRVISEELQLTPDHAFKLARFWKLNAAERQYFCLLVDFDRAADPEFRAHLKQQAQEMKAKHDSVQERAARTAFSVDTFQLGYFSSWIWTALHFLTSIPAFQTEEALADRLGLKREQLRFYLEQLSAQNFIEHKGSRWVYKGGEFHAPKNSPLVLLHHQNWRQRAILDAQDFSHSNVHFTAVHTVSKQDAESIKALMLEFITESSAIAAPSNPEEAVAVTCDFFVL